MNEFIENINDTLKAEPGYESVRVVALFRANYVLADLRRAQVQLGERERSTSTMAVWIEHCEGRAGAPLEPLPEQIPEGHHHLARDVLRAVVLHPMNPLSARFPNGGPLSGWSACVSTSNSVRRFSATARRGRR